LKHKFFKTKVFFIICLTFISFISIINAYSSFTLYSGIFTLYLNKNNSIGSQLREYYVAIEYLNTTAINTTASINGRMVNDVYTSILRFTTNTNGKMRILTNLNETVNYIIRVTVNKEETLMVNQSVFSFINGNKIIIFFEIAYSTITKTLINGIMGLIGVVLFCANPIMSYIFSNKAKDKFHFLFILMGIGIISLGLIFSFIYGG